MQILADLQLHSRFSRAVSKEMTFPTMYRWAKRKGIQLLATGDWTHPLWMREIERDLDEVGNGLLTLKNPPESPENAPVFLLATEVSCIYSQGGKVRRVHTLIWVPTLESARKISQEMTKRGCNLMSDGRPIVGLTSIQIAELVFTIEPKAIIIPAHAWTPWFAVYGSLGGFDSLEEAFGPYAKHIYAVETGLSSNPAMNWRVKELDSRTIVSFSDAHSAPKLGRELTVFDIHDQPLGYDAIYTALTNVQSKPSMPSIAYTVEFYPEEGKYHYTGHRLCNVRYTPEETKKKGTTCPVCGKPLTVGVMERVEKLAGRSEEDLKLVRENVDVAGNGTTVVMTRSKAFPHRPPFVMLVPLQEVLSECLGSPVTSPKIQGPYTALVDALGGEFNVLLTASQKDIIKIAGDRVAAGITKVRTGDLHIDPGYDGVFGVVKLWLEGEQKPLIDASKEQLTMF